MKKEPHRHRDSVLNRRKRRRRADQAAAPQVFVPRQEVRPCLNNVTALDFEGGRYSASERTHQRTWRRRSQRATERRPAASAEEVRAMTSEATMPGGSGGGPH